MNAIIVIAWCRYFSYFMIVSPIAKVTLTLYKMLYETVSFFVILCSYLFIAATIFNLLFQNAPTEDAHDYTNIFASTRSMIDFFIG